VADPSFSISQVSTLQASFGEDVEAYAAAGADGIGIWEMKLPQGADAESLARVRDSELEVTNCVPAIPSILPLPLMDGPVDPRERIEAVCASIRRLAAFEPQSVVCLTGPRGDRDSGEAHRIVIDGLRRIGREAKAAGVRVGLEPIQRIGAEDWTIPTTIHDAIELLDEVGDDNLGITFDVWSLWNGANLLEEIRDHAGRFTGVHVSDWREPTRGWCDRVLPGDGVADLPGILAGLDEAGWRGPYDLEIFSDDGTFGNDYEGSLWRLPAQELARRGREAFTAAWKAGKEGMRV
jgi:sugar phosphate isomerase/epimerase